MTESTASATAPHPPARASIMPAVALGVAVLGTIVGGAGVTFGLSAQSRTSQIPAMSQQISLMRQELAATHKREATLSARLNGASADVITCSDLLHLQISGIDSAGDQVTVGWDNGGGANAVTLPPHCINH